MKNFPLLLPLLILLFSGCDPDENYPKATSSGISGSGSTTTTLSSGVTFVPAEWRSYVGDAGNLSNPNNYRHTLVTGPSGISSAAPVKGAGLGGMSSRTTSYTLGMAASTITDTASYCSWAYSFYPLRPCAWAGHSR